MVLNMNKCVDKVWFIRTASNSSQNTTTIITLMYGLLLMLALILNDGSTAQIGAKSGCPTCYCLRYITDTIIIIHMINNSF